MNGSHPRATTSPIGWTALSGSGAWVKELIEAAPGGDGFSLVRLAPGGRARITVTDLDRFLVLEGAVELANTRGGGPARHHPGDYLVPPPAGVVDLSALGATALILRLTGRGLGGQTLDVFGPGGWTAVGPGVWAKLLIAPLPNLAESDERVVGLGYFEPGATSDRHPHPTPHRLLVLEGDAEDEMIFGDGSRETASRRAGDFIDYPTQIEHRTNSRHGNLHVFVHEAVSGGDLCGLGPGS